MDQKASFAKNMNKLFFAFLCLAVCQLAYSSEVEEKSWDDVEETEDDESRAFWDVAFNLIKKALNVQPLTCQGANCKVCLSVFGKGGCVSIAYNKQAGANAAIQANLHSSSGRHIWSGHINAGRPVPSCAHLPKPIKDVCLQDFRVTVGQGGPKGDVCFTINFRSYSLGLNFCVGFDAHSGFVPSVHPKIVKT